MQQVYEEHYTQVVVLGYGMLGNTAALLLAQAGIACCVLETKTVSDLGVAKSGRIDGETMRIWQQMGLAADLQHLLHPLRGTQIIDCKERVLMDFCHPTYPNISPIYGFYQPDVQRVLQQKTRLFKDIHIWEEMAVQAVETDASGVKIYAHHRTADVYHLFHANYLWVCAGQASEMAEEWGLEWEDFHYSASTLNVDTATQTPINTAPYAQTIYDAPMPVTRITNNALRQRWEFQLRPDDLVAEHTTERVRQLIQQFTPVEISIESAFVHSFDTKILNRWYYYRVFFLGDAAHTMPPYLGLGLSEGIKDAYNLVWKLKLKLEGTGSDAFVETYQQEREPSIRHLIERSFWVKRLFNSSWLRGFRWLVPLLPKRWLRRQLDTATWLRRGIKGNFYKNAGRWSPFFELKDVHQNETTLDVASGRGFAVIGWQNPVDALSSQNIELLAPLQTTFVQLLPVSFRGASLPLRYVTYLFDYQGKIAEWMRQERIAWIVLRPDKIIYDAVADVNQLNKTLQKLTIGD